MPNTYSQLYIQTVFAVQNRISLIANDWREELHKYITGIVTKNKHKLIAIGGVADHVHLFFGYDINQTIPDLMQDVKRSSSLWINERKFVKGKFSWQEGYGAFSYSPSHIDRVVKYIANQEKHHKKRSFTDEYIDFLNKFNVLYDERYIFKPIDV